MNNLPAAFSQAVTQHRDRIALIDGQGQSVSFGELQQRSQHFATRCAASGIGKGDRVLVATPVGINLYVVLSAIWTLGAVAVFPEPALGLKGLRHAAQVTKPKAYFTSGILRLLSFIVPELWGLPVFQPDKNPVGDVDVHDAALHPDDLSLISFTSGTTGKPKAIPRSHRFMMAQHHAVKSMLESAKPERDLVAFPVFVLVNLAAGRTSVLPNWKLTKHDKVSANRIGKWIEAQCITRLLFPPVLCETLADGLETNSLAKIDSIFTGGGPVFPDIIEKLKTLAPTMRIVSVYGSTEAEPIAELEASDTSHEDLVAMRAGGGLLAGHPIHAVQMRTLEGEILVTGDHVNKAYLDPVQDQETKFVEDGVIWHRTGDAGRIDEMGRLWLLGRWGQDIETEIGTLHPFAIETAVRFWPGVHRAALSRSVNCPVLAIEGDPNYIPIWTENAAQYGLGDVRHIVKIPMDRRHRSKVDSRQLEKILNAS